MTRLGPILVLLLAACAARAEPAPQTHGARHYLAGLPVRGVPGLQPYCLAPDGRVTA